MAGLQVGRKIYTINEDLLFLRPFSEVETMINQAFCLRRSLRLLVATKAKEWGTVHNQSGTRAQYMTNALIACFFFQMLPSITHHVLDFSVYFMTWPRFGWSLKIISENYTHSVNVF